MLDTIETSQLPPDTLLAQGPLPPAQALRHALQFAQALRASHESGHGCSAIDTWRDGLRRSAPSSEAEALRPYTPPEVLAGSAADIRSDVYTLGAILYHLLTGRPPFLGAHPASAGYGAPAPLAPPASLLPGLETVVFRCLAQDPTQRWQNLQVVAIELKLLSAAADRLRPASEARHSVESRLREQVARLETALDARDAVSEQTLASLREAVSETRDYVRTAFEFVEDRLRCQAVVIDKLQTAARQAEEGLDQLTTSVALCEQSAGELRRGAERSRTEVCDAMQQIDGRFEIQARSIHELHATAGRTDDLLERVVESIDSLQSFVLERTGEHPPD